MSVIPKDKISCKICKYRGESPISGAGEGCSNFAKFEIDYDNVCKWCYNPVAPGDNICAAHRKSHNEHSWPGCIESDAVKNEQRQRRERIATAIMAGLIDSDVSMQGLRYAAQTALIGADILINEIDGAKE